MEFFCGIDQGITGGITVLDKGSEIIQSWVMPAFRRDDITEVDIKGVSDILCDFLAHTQTYFMLERPLKHAKSSQAHASMGRSYGRLSALLDLSGCRWKPIDPRAWQKALLGKKIPKGETKIRAVAKCLELWPSEDWRASARCKVEHLGKIDSALIAFHLLNTHK
jgi:hypothetical protein